VERVVVSCREEVGRRDGGVFSDVQIVKTLCQ